MRISETALFILPVWNLTSSSCSSTPISYMTREFWRFANILQAEIGIFMSAWIFRVNTDRETNGRTHAGTETNWTYNLPDAIWHAIAMGQIWCDVVTVRSGQRRQSSINDSWMLPTTRIDCFVAGEATVQIRRQWFYYFVIARQHGTAVREPRCYSNSVGPLIFHLSVCLSVLRWVLL